MDLAEKREWIEYDRTERETGAIWMVRREAKKEGRNGKKVNVGYTKLWIDGIYRKWDEREVVLRDEVGTTKEEDKKQVEETKGT